MRLCIVAILVVGILTVAASPVLPQKKAWTPLRAGDTAASFTVQTLDGARLSSSDLRGKVVLLNFWGTY